MQLFKLNLTFTFTRLTKEPEFKFFCQTVRSYIMQNNVKKPILCKPHSFHSLPSTDAFITNSNRLYRYDHRQQLICNMNNDVLTTNEN